jgi:Tfp pilus assembly protein PilW
MLVVLAIVSVLIGAVFVSSLMGGKLYFSSEIFVHVQQQARQAFDNMVQELRQADGAIAVAVNQCTFQLALGYNLPAPCPANAVCVGARDANGVNQSGWSLRYRLNGTQLVREILNPAGVVQPGTRVLANDVSSLAFTYTGGSANTVTVQLQVQRTSQQLAGGSLAAAPTPLITRVRLRNP